MSRNSELQDATISFELRCIIILSRSYLSETDNCAENSLLSTSVPFEETGCDSHGASKLQKWRVGVGREGCASTQSHRQGLLAAFLATLTESLKIIPISSLRTNSPRESRLAAIPLASKQPKTRLSFGTKNQVRSNCPRLSLDLV